MSRLLLVEGVPGVGKSTLLDALVRRLVEERPPRQIRTLLHLTQAHTCGPIAPAEDAGTLTPAAALAHLDAVTGLLEWLVRSVTLERVPRLFVLVDTLHLTHVHRPGVLGPEDVDPIDARLAALGCRLVFLRASPETLRRRAIDSRAGTQFLREYAPRKWGPTPDDIRRGILAEQEGMLEHLGRSRLARLVVDADSPLEEYLDAVHGHWLDRA